MLLYRVLPYDAAARPGYSGHPLYLHTPQGTGRWDNPALYDAWYLSTAAEGAVGETFGNLAEWSTAMFEHPATGLPRALVTFSVPDDLSVFDLDDAGNLSHLGMRPSQVVIRNPGYTQARAADVFHELRADGSPRWAGLRWWSFHRPTWTNVVLWSRRPTPPPLTLREVQLLELTTPAVLDVASSLSRVL